MESVSKIFYYCSLVEGCHVVSDNAGRVTVFIGWSKQTQRWRSVLLCRRKVWRMIVFLSRDFPKQERALSDHCLPLHFAEYFWWFFYNIPGQKRNSSRQQKNTQGKKRTFFHRTILANDYCYCFDDVLICNCTTTRGRRARSIRLYEWMHDSVWEKTKHAR